MASDDRTLSDPDDASATRGAARDAIAVQRSEVGGTTWGAAFFGRLRLLVVLLLGGGLGTRYHRRADRAGFAG